MTKQERDEKIAIINQKISNKELSFGCRIQTTCGESEKIIRVFDESGELKNGSRKNCYIKLSGVFGDFGKKYVLDNFIVTGHPVMLGDVICWTNGIEMGKERRMEFDYETIASFSNLTGPIEDQRDNCINRLIRIIKTLESQETE